MSKVKTEKRIKRLSRLASAAIIVLLIAGFYVFYMRFEPDSGYGGEAWTADSAFDMDGIKSVTLREGRASVKVAQLADLHLWIGNLFSDRTTMNYIDKLIEDERPDICVVTGDAAMTPLNETALKYLCEFMEKRQQHWAYVFGNHDAEFGISKYRVSNMLSSYKYCLFSAGPKNIGGAGNYFVNVKNSNGEVVYTLVMMDSGMYAGKDSTEKYGSFSEAQVAWYEWTLNNIINAASETPVLQSMAFFHIPVKQFNDLYESGNYQGEKNKNIAAQGADTGFFDAAKRLNSTKAVFVGHDHINNMRGFFDGIYLCYGRLSGYSAYPTFNTDSLAVKLLGKEDDVKYNADLYEGGRGFTIIEITDLDLNSTQYGNFTVTDLLHKDMN